MKIDEMKNSFVELLRAKLNTSEMEESEILRAKPDENGFFEVYLSEGILAENALGGTTFWECVCSSLKTEGILKRYSNPSDLGSDFEESLFKLTQLPGQINFLPLHLWDEKNMEATFKKHQEIEKNYRKRYTHRFLVNKEKLFSKRTDKEEISSDIFVFTLAEDGTLSRKNLIKGDKPYKMEIGKLPFNVFKELLEAQSKNALYYETKELASTLGVEEAKIRKTIESIKNQVEKSFNGIRRSDFIESLKNSGYRLHTQIRVLKI